MSSIDSRGAVCPRCTAQVGQPCRQTNGRALQVPHIDRRRAWQRRPLDLDSATVRALVHALADERLSASARALVARLMEATR